MTTTPALPLLDELDELRAKATCAVAGCGRAYRARGYCGAHYQQARKAGEFIPVPHYAHAHDLLQRNAVMTRSGCWEWIGTRSSQGYGHTRYDGRDVLVHRLSYEEYVGPIPDGHQLDHLCRNRACVRPDHLEPVTGRVNTLRSTALPAINARKTHCKRGHEFTAANTKRVTTKYGHPGRACRACSNARASRTTALEAS